MTCFMYCRQYGVWTINRHQYSNFITLFNQSKSRTAVKLMVIPKCRVTSISKEKLCHRHAKKIIFFLSIFYNIFHSVLSQKKTGFFIEQNSGFSAQIYRVTLTKTCLNKKAWYNPKLMIWTEMNAIYLDLACVG